MKLNEKGIFKKTLFALIFANLLTFLFYHLSTYTVKGAVSAYAFFYIREVLEFTLPVLTALALYLTALCSGVGSALKAAVPYSLATVIFKFPYHAFEYAYEGIEISGVMLFSALNALLGAVVFYIEATALYLLISIARDRAAKKNDMAKSDIAAPAKPFDLNSPINFGILAAVGAMFVYKLISEIIDTVSYFISYIDTYRASEIAYITFRYIYLLILAVLAHLAIASIKNYVLKNSEEDAE